ncbi:MAG TPA: hypothetical protein VM870_10580 [Pyrinomonadaceae bacterium]|nr:hypothetical protein [Pyrinomonadaceae bacterium]
MNKFSRVMSLLVVMFLAAGVSLAQRSRTVGDSNEVQQTPTSTTSPGQTPPPAPPTVKAKYEGGVFGHNKKVDGTLNFDDVNDRLLFRNKEQKELVSIPYKAILASFADTQSRRPRAASIIGGASLYTLPALLIKKKYRYLTVQYKDPDTQASGITSFKIDDKETLASVLNTLAEKSGLTARGEVFVRRNEGTTTQ